MAKINPVKLKQDADRLEKSGKVPEAIALYKQVIDDNPRDWNVINKVGDLYAKQNKFREASEQYAKVADFYAKDGFHLKAIAIWKKINKLDASALEPYVNLAELYGKQGLMMEAKSQYQYVVDEYIKRGKMRDAGEVLRKMADIDPGDLKIRSKLADLYIREGNSAKAVEEHIAIAEELNKKGHLAEGLQVLEKGLKIDPRSTRLRIELARIHLVQKNHDKAARYLEEAIQQSPSDTAILARLGEAYLGSRKVEEAEAIFKRLLELDPGDEDARVQMARVFLLHKQHDRAFEQLGPLVEKLLARKDGERAAALLQQIVQSDPSHLRTLNRLVEIYQQLGKESSLLATYSQLTEAYIQQGQLAEAASVLELLVAREPQNHQHRSKLDFVRGKLAAGGRAPAPAASAESVDEEFDLSGAEEAPALDLGGAPPPAAPARTAAPAPAPRAPARPAIEATGPLSAEDKEFIEEHLAEGKVFRKYGLVDKAADQFEAVVARFPDNAEARQELRDIYRDKGVPVKAAEQCLALAEIFRLKGDEAAAAAQEEEADRLAPGSSPRGRVSVAAPPAPAAAAPAAPAGPATRPAAPAPKPAAPKPAPAPPPPAVEEEEISLAPEEEQVPLAVAEEEIPLEVEEAPAAPAAEEETFDLGAEIGGAEAQELPAQFIDEEPLAGLGGMEAPPPAPAGPEEAEFDLGGPVETPPAREEVAVGFEEFPLDEAVAEPAPPPAAPPRPSAPAPLKAAPLAPARPAAAPAAAGVPAELARVLEEIDSYVSLGFVDDAKEALREARARFGDHAALTGKIAALGLEEAMGEPEEAALAEEPPALVGEAAGDEFDLGAELGGMTAPPEEPAAGAEAPEEDVLGDLGAELPPEPEAPAVEEPFGAAEAFGTEDLVGEGAFPAEPALAETAAAAEPSGIGDDLLGIVQAAEAAEAAPVEGLDLGDELGELFGAQSAVGEEAPSAPSTELGDAGLADIFKEFKKGVDKQLGREDYDTRYNLGIAYKEMGLVDEAIAEFQLAAKDETRVLECSSMLGICFLEKGMPKLAIKWFEKGLKVAGRTDEEYAGLRYDLAVAHEAAGEIDKALSLFTDLYGQDANFRDVAAKVRELRAALG